MNKIYHDVILDIKKETYAEVKVNQNDANSRVIRATIQDNGKTMTLADTLSAVLRYTKKDGNGVEAEATITDGKVEVDLKEGMLSAPGNTPATITLYENGQVLSTMVFYLFIDRSPLQDNTVISSPEYSALDKEHKQLQEELKKSEQMVESATESAETAAEKAAEASTSAASAATAEGIATEKAAEASTSAASAAEAEGTATEKATEAATSAASAATAEGIATEKATEAAASAASAATAEGIATEKATEAATSADSAKNYAEGVTDSAKYYYEQAKRISESFSGALRPMGTVTFSSLPSIEDAAEGDMYNISNEFTTTEDFKEGSGIVSPAGSNIYKTSDGYWDILAGTPVTGVKGKKESSYRRGNVNITPANIGALPENGDSKEVITTFTSEDSTSDMDNVLPDILESGETHASIFNKLSRLVKNVRWIVKTIGTTDISSIGDGTLTGAASELNNSLELIRSHVGMIIQSTTLDTEEKVKDIYGGIKWTKIEGRFLLGASSSYKVNTTGGESSHTLTINEIPAHSHTYTGSQYAALGQYGTDISTPQNVGSFNTGTVGRGQAHNNMPPYKSVYIWERTE